MTRPRRADIRPDRKANRDAAASAVSLVSVERGAVLCAGVPLGQFVYALTDPAEPERIRYVGRTASPVERYRIHLCQGTPRVKEWMESVVKAGRWPVMRCLEVCDEDTVEERESHWITWHQYHDGADLNVSFRPNIRTLYRLKQEQDAR